MDGAVVAAGIVALAFVLIAATYSLVTPIWEAPDEVGHMRVVTHLVTTGALPTQHEHALGQAHQPPLYYALAALPVLAVDLTDQSGRFRFNPDIAWGKGQRSQVNAALHGPDERFPYRGRALAVHLARAVSVLCGLAAGAPRMITEPHRRGVASGLLANGGNLSGTSRVRR